MFLCSFLINSCFNKCPYYPKKIKKVIYLLLFFTLANIALPGTSSFVGEFLILTGIYKINTIITFISATGMILGGGYSLWLFNRVVYGNLKVQYINQFCDMEKREFFVFLPLITGTLVMGIYPELFLDPMHMSINNLIDQIKSY